MEINYHVNIPFLFCGLSYSMYAHAPQQSITLCELRAYCDLQKALFRSLDPVDIHSNMQSMLRKPLYRPLLSPVYGQGIVQLRPAALGAMLCNASLSLQSLAITVHM